MNDMTEQEIRARYLEIRKKVLDMTATVAEAGEAARLLEAMSKFQQVRDREPKQAL